MAPRSVSKANVKTLTAGEIASKLASDEELIPHLVERIRHWTREGLLRPVGERNPGTGKHRRYNNDAVLQAAILNAFTDAGMTTSTLRSLPATYSGLKDEYQSWVADRKRSHPGYLCLYRLFSGEPAIITLTQVLRHEDDFLSAVIVNLLPLFRQYAGTHLGTELRAGGHSKL